MFEKLLDKKWPKKGQFSVEMYWFGELWLVLMQHKEISWCSINLTISISGSPIWKRHKEYCECCDRRKKYEQTPQWSVYGRRNETSIWKHSTPIAPAVGRNFWKNVMLLKCMVNCAVGCKAYLNGKDHLGSFCYGINWCCFVMYCISCKSCKMYLNGSDQVGHVCVSIYQYYLDMCGMFCMWRITLLMLIQLLPLPSGS